jgi:hypothetical protein
MKKNNKTYILLIVIFLLGLVLTTFVKPLLEGAGTTSCVQGYNLESGKCVQAGNSVCNDIASGKYPILSGGKCARKICENNETFDPSNGTCYRNVCDKKIGNIQLSYSGTEAKCSYTPQN